MPRFRFLYRPLPLLLLALILRFAASAAAEPARDLTFFVVSDLHYNFPAPGDATLQRDAIKELNAVAGQAYPKEIGGTVAAPRGVIVVGDLVESTANNAIAAWEADFGLKGESLLKYPVYEGLGNHDQRGPTAWDALKRRNPLRAAVDHISENGFHYAWDWDGIRFIHLNVCGANAPDLTLTHKTDQRQALDFLTTDLTDRVGGSGRPVVILQHYDFNTTNTWSDAQKDAFFSTVKPYNVICMFHGHTHRAEHYEWRGITVLNDGAVKNEKRDSKISSFLVVRIQGNRLQAVQRMVGGKWGRVRFEKSFERGRPESAPPAKKLLPAAH